MADANKTAFYFMQESAFGVAASGANPLTIIPTLDSFAHTQGFASSQRIRSDRQIDGTFRNAIGASGDWGVEFSWGRPYDTLFMLAAMHDFSASTFAHLWSGEAMVVNTGFNVSVTSTTVFTLAAGSWTTTPTAYNYVKVEGFDNAENNGWFLVASATASTITITGATLVVEGNNNDVLITEYDSMVDGGTISIQFTEAQRTIGPTGSWMTTPAVGDWVYVFGAVDEANHGYHKVTNVVGDVVTLSPGPSVDDLSAAGVVILPYVKNGVYQSYWTVERFFEDGAGAGSDLQDLFTGMSVNGMTVTVPTDNAVTGSFSWMGQKQSAAGTASVFSAPLSHNTNEIFNGIDYVPRILLGGTEVTNVTSVTFTLNNNLRARNAIGTLGATSIGTGTIDITGSLQIYLQDNVEYAKAIADTATSLAFFLDDGSGNGFGFDFPNVKYDAPRRVAGGINTDVIVELPFRAIRGATETDTTIKIIKR